MFDSAKLLMIGGAVLLAGALLGTAYHKVKESGRDEIREEWKASALKEAEQGRKAVEDAVAKAQEHADKDQKEREAREQVEREAQQHQAEEASKKSRDLERRYRDAITHNASCAAQMEMVILCPLE